MAFMFPRIAGGISTLIRAHDHFVPKSPPRGQHLMLMFLSHEIT